MNHRHLIKYLSLTAMLAPLAGFAQTAPNNQAQGKSWLPYTYNGYWGVNLGAPDYEKHCAAGFGCNDPDVGGKIYIGGQFNQWLGAEIGYINVGKFDRNGGDTTAQGVNISLVGTVPVNNVFSVFGKVGTTYGWTKTEGAIAPTGKKDDFGLSYGAGLGFNLSPQTQLLVEWDRHNFKFVDDRADVDMYSVGLKVRF
ncbi:MAG: porin family protein [Rhodocyclaceae bacterium]|nr:porin family protein [Rhodocyclaceae bacterium]